MSFRNYSQKIVEEVIFCLNCAVALMVLILSSCTVIINLENINFRYICTVLNIQQFFI